MMEDSEEVESSVPLLVDLNPLPLVNVLEKSPLISPSLIQESSSKEGQLNLAPAVQADFPEFPGKTV